MLGLQRSHSTEGIHGLSYSSWFPEVLLLFHLSFKFLIIFFLDVVQFWRKEGRREKKLLTGHVTRHHVCISHILPHNHPYSRYHYLQPYLFKMKTLCCIKVQTLVQIQTTWMWYCRALNLTPMFFPLKLSSKICLTFPYGCFHN